VRFHAVIRGLLAPLPGVMALPMVLLHKDLVDRNIIVEEASCRLVGVLGWAKAEVGPFGTNLHSVLHLITKVYLRNG
jgi:aminoglycoside phosphotransferase (APT) family kinase protein